MRRRARAHDGLGQRGRRAASDAAAVEPGPAAAPGGERLIPEGVVYEAELEPSADDQCQDGSGERHTVREVGSAVDGVAYPKVLRRLRQEAV